MSRPFTLQQRLTSSLLVPVVIGVIALAVSSVVLFGEGQTAFGSVAMVAALAIIAAAWAVHSRLLGDVRRSVNGLVGIAHALRSGSAIESSTTDIVELAPVANALGDLAEQQRVIIAQSEAIASGSFDSPILTHDAQGVLGPIMRQSLDGLRSATEQLRDSEAVNASIMDNVSDAIAVVDADGRLIASNRIADLALELFEGSLDAAIPGWQQLAIGEVELSRTLEDGTLALTQIQTSKMITTSGPVTMLCWRDMSGERAIRAQVSHVSRTDIVTGLPNRYGLLAAYDRLRDLGQPASVIHLDLKDFGQVNQRHGFEAGDFVLQEIAARLRRIVRDEDTASRASGDEFILLLTSRGDVVESLTRRMLDRIADPITLRDGTELTIGAHAGWTSGEPGDDYELLRRAAYALVEAKDDPGSVMGYSAEIAARDAKKRDWEQQLRRAIDQDEFALFAQPIVDVLERRVLGVEIFLRWHHPSGQFVSPNEFIAIAEESDLILDIDRWVIQKTIAAASDADPNVVFSLNVSNRFIASSSMADFVRSSLTARALPAGRIQIDVTETNVAGDVQGAIESIRDLDEMGVKVALDDFGTGYSSLAHLLKLAISTIKIDRRMVSMVTEPEGRGVVAAILAFARKRNLTVISEGVESPEEVTELAELGCRFQQGYFHGRPAPVADVLASLHAIPFGAPAGDKTRGRADDVPPLDAAAGD